MRSAEDVVFTTVAFPVGMFVGIVFWALYLHDKESMIPPGYEKYVPPMRNHMMHTVMMPFLLYEMASCRHEYPRPAWRGAAVTAAVELVYLAWLLFLGIVAGVWSYPILQVLPPLGKALFLATNMSVGVALYYVGWWMSGLRWGRKRTEEDEEEEEGEEGKEAERRKRAETKRREQRARQKGRKWY